MRGSGMGILLKMRRGQRAEGERQVRLGLGKVEE